MQYSGHDAINISKVGKFQLLGNMKHSTLIQTHPQMTTDELSDLL